MKSLVVKSLMRVFVFLFVLLLTVSGAWAATVNTFILSDEAGGNFIAQLVNAGYGNYNLYDALVVIQQNANPSVAGIITPTFLNTLNSCPVNSSIFTAKLNSIPTGSSVAISDDCTWQLSGISGDPLCCGLSGFPELLTTMSGVANTPRFIYTTDTQNPVTSFQANGNTYNVFAIGWMQHWTTGIANQQTFILSDEAPGHLITNLVNAGYGDYNLYDALVAIQQSTNPSVAGILTDSFLQALAGCPPNNQVLTTKLNTISTGSSVAINTGCEVQTVNVHANTFFNLPGTSTLQSNISGVGSANFVHIGAQPLSLPTDWVLTSWQNISSPFFSTIDRVFAIAFALSNHVVIPAATGNGNITLDTSSQGCSFYNVSTMTEAQVGHDPSFDYPYGLVSFSLNCAQADVTITFPGSISGTTYRKHGPTTPGDSATTAWYTFSNVTANGSNSIILHLADNQLGDDTGEDGIIVDQGGPGRPPIAVPTMTEWGMIIFVLLAGLGSVYYLRRQKRTNS